MDAADAPTRLRQSSYTKHPQQVRCASSEAGSRKPEGVAGRPITTARLLRITGMHRRVRGVRWLGMISKATVAATHAMLTG
jgi:hypothetical protein